MQTKFGAIIVDGSGKTNGHVATKNRNGNVLRTKIKPSNKRSKAQMNIRSLFATIAGKWNSLTVEQVLAWNAAAENVTYSNAFGDKKKYTGRALFQQVNMNIGLTDKTKMLEDPPTPDGSDEDIVETEDDYWEDYFDQVRCHFNRIIGDTVGILVYSTPPLRNGQTTLMGIYITISSRVGTEEVFLDITNALQNAFGSISVGQRFSIYIRLVNNLTGFNKTLPPKIIQLKEHV